MNRPVLEAKRSKVLAACALLAATLGTSPLAAQGIGTVPLGSPTESAETQDAQPPAPSPLGSPPGTRWRLGEARWFVASRIEAGFFLLRPRVALGYGRPHFSWTGLELVPIVSTQAIGAYFGLRWERELYTLRGGSLYQYSYNRSLLPLAESYTLDDIDLLNGPRVQYWLADTELEFYVPMGPLRLRSETQLLYAGGIDHEHRFFLDTLKLIVGRGLTLRQRLGAEFFIPGSHIGVQPSVELLWPEERGRPTLRAGLLLRWLLSDELQLRASILPVIYSPDSLGRMGGEVFDVAMRWSWASR